MTDVFSLSGSTEEISSEDLLRELCGDEQSSPIVDDANGDANNDYFSKSEEMSASNQEKASASQEEKTGGFLLVTGEGNFDEYLAAHRGQYFIYDIETFPDESRFPRPVSGSRARADVDIPKLMSGNADIITRTLKSGTLMEDQLVEMLDLESVGKNRTSVLSAIQKAIDNLDGEFDDWKKNGSVDPWQGRIVAMSWSFLGEDEVHTLLAKNEEEERALLTTFWLLHEVGIRVGYNIAAFDDRWMIIRSMILGVSTAKPMQSGRYSSQLVDIMLKLFPTLSEAKDCKLVAEMLGIRVPAEGMSGSDVFGMVESRSWDLLTRYSASDVAVEKDMFRILKRYVSLS